MPRLSFFLLCGAALLGMTALQVQAQPPPRVPTVDEQIRKLADDAPLKLQFHGKTADECRQW
jgi:hypothetical protein